jgi:flagellar motor switch protein FliM
MAEFLSQEEIDTLLDIAGQVDDYVKNMSEIQEILNIIKNENKSNRIERLLLLTKIDYYIRKELESITIDQNTLQMFHNHNGFMIDELIEKLKDNNEK